MYNLIDRNIPFYIHMSKEITYSKLIALQIKIKLIKKIDLKKLIIKVNLKRLGRLYDR